MSFKIKPLKSERDSVYRTPAQKAFAMPGPGSMILVGSTGSGKTTIVGNLLREKAMLSGYYDKIYVFCLSPCNTLVDNVEEIEEDDVFLEDDTAPLEEIFEKQKASVKKVGFGRSKHILLILDDIVQSKNFMGCKQISNIMFGGTHSKTSIWILSQSYMSVPRRWRMNTHSLILCHGVNNTEIDRFALEWQSCYMSKDEFIKMIKQALAEPYSFVFVNAAHNNKKEMYRKGFDIILEIM